MQIHVERQGFETKIKVFSKLKRESTAERGNAHA